MQDDLSLELRFTEIYRRNANAPAAIREAECLKVQFPAILTAIQSSDLFAGRIRYGKVGFSPQFGGFGYFCDETAIIREIERGNIPIGQHDAVLEMLQFWHKETTTRKIEAAFDERMAQTMCRDELYPFPFQLQPEIASPLYRMAGVYVNYAKLMRLGICGLRSAVQGYLAEGTAAGIGT